MRFSFHVATLAVAGCWTQAVEPSAPGATLERPRPRDVPVVERRLPPSRIPVTSVWTGTYTCSQGLTGVTLTLELIGSTAVGVFEFFPVPQNPSRVLTGTTKLTGSLTELADGGFVVDLDPDSWIVQPGGYSMVGMTATIDGKHLELHGTIKHPNCNEIDATRVDR